MLHYTHPEKGTDQLTGICKYCGKPLKDPNSVIRGFGDVCFEKHRQKRIRQIVKERNVTNGSDGNGGSVQNPTWDTYKHK